MRYGFTTGSCAAAAAKAAAWMLLSGMDRKQIEIITPAGIPFQATLLDRVITSEYAACSVEKDGGDDPDVTTGLRIRAEVRRAGEQISGEKLRIPGERIRICGGEGVGIVTEPGLDQPVGEAAINHVPREMITQEVCEVADLMDEEGMLIVTVSVPGGRERAEKTFNPRLGIKGGISIIGTSGIVEPMSEKALLETIRLELRQRRAKGQEIAVVTPGNYGMDMLKKTYDYDLDHAVKCSNFIGETIDFAAEEGFSRMVLLGHMGKLVKCAGGMLNTHSRYGDHRMELICEAAMRQGVDGEIGKEILGCVSTEAAFSLLPGAAGKRVAEDIRQRGLRVLRDKAAGRIRLDTILYTNSQGILAAGTEAEAWLKEEKTGGEHGEGNGTEEQEAAVCGGDRTGKTGGNDH